MEKKRATAIERKSSRDRISELPCNVIEIILMFLPLRDMMRTSVLSRDWRFRWKTVPQLIFEDDPHMFRFLPFGDKYNFRLVIGILEKHQGPLWKFALDLSDWSCYYGIGQIIHFLARNRIEELNLTLNEMFPKLPYFIYSCAELKHLSLKTCLFQPSLLVWFTKLVTLKLVSVGLERNVHDVSISGCPSLVNLTLEIVSKYYSFSIDAPNLEMLSLKGCISDLGFMKTPLLKGLSLMDETDHFMDLWKNNKFSKILRSLPFLESLCLFKKFINALAFADSSKELPAVLNNLKVLQLSGVNITIKSHVSNVLWLIRNAPNLEKLEFKMCHGVIDEEPELCFQMSEYCGYSLMKLREVKFDIRTDLMFYVEFMKFLLAISPELETLYIDIKLVLDFLKKDGCKTLLPLTCSRRASPKAEIIFIGLD